MENGIGKQKENMALPVSEGMLLRSFMSDYIRMFLENTDRSLIHFGGSGNAGVTQRKIVYVLCAYYSGALLAIFKQLSDHGTGGT